MQSKISNLKSNNLPMQSKISNLKSNSLPMQSKTSNLKSNSLPMQSKISNLKSNSLPMQSKIENLKSHDSHLIRPLANSVTAICHRRRFSNVALFSGFNYLPIRLNFFLDFRVCSDFWHRLGCFIYCDPAVSLGSRLARRVSIARWDLGSTFCVIFNQNYRFARDTCTRF